MLFDFVGGDFIYFVNLIKYVDFNGLGECFWQVCYDFDLVLFGLLGLSFMVCYVSGCVIDGSYVLVGGVYNLLGVDGCYWFLQGSGGKYWECDFDLCYLFVLGLFKDFLLNVLYFSYWVNVVQVGDDIDCFYLIVEYLFKGLF